MSRYRRINIDGKSLYKTETRRTAASLLPGTLAIINEDGEFAQADTVVGRMYVVDNAYHQGLGIRDAIPLGDSAVGNYIEEGRELAILMPAGTYTKDQPITLGASGMGAAAASDTAAVLGYSQDDATIASGQTDFIRVRFRVGSVAASA